MNVPILFIGRLLWVLLNLLIMYPLAFFIIVILGTLWTFDFKNQYDEWVKIRKDPFDKEEYNIYLGRTDTYWVYQTIWDYLLLRKTIITKDSTPTNVEFRPNNSNNENNQS